MKRIKLMRQEKEIEDTLMRGEYVNVSREEFKRIADMLEARKKNAVLNIRINRYDLERLKQKARKLGVRYQTFISEILHKVAQAH